MHEIHLSSKNRCPSISEFPLKRRRFSNFPNPSVRVVEIQSDDWRKFRIPFKTVEDSSHILISSWYVYNDTYISMCKVKSRFH